MSVGQKTTPKAVTVHSLLAKKSQGQKIVSITCYDYSTARILDEARSQDVGVDLLLVGDSLAMTVLGHPNTLSVTMDEMLHHTKAVARGAKIALVAADMPFMSYQNDHVSAVRNAARFVQEGGAAAVKLEGAGSRVLAVIEHLVEAGIPVIGHLGFTPQSLNTLGGYKVQGKTLEGALKLFEDAKALERVGCFALVLEMVPVELANVITQHLRIPTIGIGAGNGCDGQILVVDDVLGRYTELTPRFVRPYMNGKALIAEAVQAYARDIAQQNFPNNDSEAFAFPPDLLPDLMLALAASA